MLISRPISWLTNSSFRPELSASIDGREKLGQMGAKPDDLLADIAAVGQDRDLPDQVFGLDRHALVLHEGRDPLDKPLLVILGDLRALARRSGSTDRRRHAPSAISSAAIARPSAARADWSFDERLGRRPWRSRASLGRAPDRPSE